MIQLINFLSIRVRGAANYRHQQPHCHQIQNLFGGDTLDDPVVNLTLRFGGWSGKWFRFRLNRVWEALILFTSLLSEESIKTHPLRDINCKSFIENHILKILIIVLKIVFSSSPTLNALGVDTLGNLIAEVSGTISVVNCGGPIFFLFPSLLRGLSIIGMLKIWRLGLSYDCFFYYMEEALYLEVFVLQLSKDGWL